jgi:phosphoenolpyruvate synthase/pyruvate phosphate dikinase
MDVRARIPLVAWLGATPLAPDAWDGLLGGKAASLERLLRMGAPTPPGFCITTEAFRAQLHGGPHASQANAAIRALPSRTAATVLADLLTSAPFAAELAEELETGLARLAASDPGVRFAVRSSAVGEDGNQASFAGIHETELGLAADEVPAAVRRCWASLWSDRALEYRAARGLPLDGAMAVVVQRLVPAEAAAVVFTRHPLTGREDVVYLNAVHGLGETLVSGTVTPDEVVLRKADLAILGLVAGDAERVLTDAQLADLARLSLDLERQFHRPIDVEAAHADGQWYILQARPITA